MEISDFVVFCTPLFEKNRAVSDIKLNLNKWLYISLWLLVAPVWISVFCIPFYRCIHLVDLQDAQQFAEIQLGGLWEEDVAFMGWNQVLLFKTKILSFT